MPIVPAPTANEVFKQRSSRNIWGGVLAAVMLHVLLFALAPTMAVTNLSAAAIEVAVIQPAEPPPPQQPEDIVQPGPPVVGDVDADVTIPNNTNLYDTHQPLPAPPAADRAAAREIDAFMPRDVEPVLRNVGDVQRLLERTYPPLLRDAGIGGTAIVWFFIDETGAVRETRLNSSSGRTALDRAALAAAKEMKFRPAQLRGRAVPVWVSIPIVFTAH